MRNIDYGESLLSLPNLPPLNGAPIGSWFLARLACLTRGFGQDFESVQGNDGGIFYLRLLVFDSTHQRIAEILFKLSASEINAEISHSTSIESPLGDFTKALAVSPQDLADCRAINEDSDAQGSRYPCRIVLGWEHDRYLGPSDPNE